jgi:hypothetical protein
VLFAAPNSTRPRSAARCRTRNPPEGRDYLSVKLDYPALTQAVNCALVESSDREGFILVWGRATAARRRPSKSGRGGPARAAPIAVGTYDK